MLRSCPALLACALFAVTAAAGDRPAPLKKGDRIVFLGDSITAGAAGKKGYITFIKQKLDEKHKDLNIQTLGAGISGNKVPDLQRRVDAHVIAKNPTVVFIYIGINDVWHGERNPANGTSREQFEAGLKEVITKIKDAGARVILCTPSVIGEKKNGANNLDARLDAYADISRNVVRTMKVQLCDLRKAFVDYLKQNNPENKDRGVLTGDRVHLNETGNRLVAETMLKSLGE